MIGKNFKISPQSVLEYKNTLFLVKASDLDKEVYSVLENASKQGKCLFVSTSKSYQSVRENAKNYDIVIPNLFIVDCVSADAKVEDHENLRNIYFAGGLSALTNLSILLSQYVESLSGSHGCIIFDTLHTLLTQNDSKMVIKFVSQTMSYLSVYQNLKSAVFMIKDADNNFLNQIYNFFDKVIER